MPYFIIIPLYLSFFVALLAIGGVMRLTRFRRAAPYIWGGAFGSASGFLVANALLLGGLLMFMRFFPNAHSPLSPGFEGTLAAIALGGALVVVPFLVSALGVAAGTLGGVYVARRMVRREKQPPFAPLHA